MLHYTYLLSTVSRNIQLLLHDYVIYVEHNMYKTLKCNNYNNYYIMYVKDDSQYPLGPPSTEAKEMYFLQTSGVKVYQNCSVLAFSPSRLFGFTLFLRNCFKDPHTALLDCSAVTLVVYTTNSHPFLSKFSQRMFGIFVLV